MASRTPLDRPVAIDLTMPLDLVMMVLASRFIGPRSQTLTQAFQRSRKRRAVLASIVNSCCRVHPDLHRLDRVEVLRFQFGQRLLFLDRQTIDVLQENVAPALDLKFVPRL